MPRKQLSATAFGSVMHTALHAGLVANSMDTAMKTFQYYWNPMNIEAVCPPVDVWQPRQTYASLMARGKETIKRFWELEPFDDIETIGLEYEFEVELDGVVDPQDGSTVVLAGTVDRLAIAKFRRRPVVLIDDFKTGKIAPYTRHALQGTAYCYATTREKFWDQFDPMVFMEYATAPRRFRLTDLQNMKYVDGGFRGSLDYKRFLYTAQQFVNACHHETFVPTMDGSVCQWCDYRDQCAGIGLDDREGHPDNVED